VISEPELNGGLDCGPSVHDVISDEGRGPAMRARPTRPWTWALGGAVAASAIWAAGVTVWDPGHRALPDLHGYHLRDNLCQGDALRPLFDAIPARTFTAEPADTLRGSALDRATCTAETLVTAGDGKSVYDYVAALSVELHKKTDPRPEFEDDTTGAQSLIPAAQVDAVLGLGDDAYLLHQEPGRVQLRVLDGGAVFSLTFSVDTEQPDGTGRPAGTDQPDPPDADQYRPALIASLRTVMADLKESPSATP
jgi:hypothetical protein